MTGSNTTIEFMCAKSSHLNGLNSQLMTNGKATLLEETTHQLRFKTKKTKTLESRPTPTTDGSITHNIDLHLPKKQL